MWGVLVLHEGQLWGVRQVPGHDQVWGEGEAQEGLLGEDLYLYGSGGENSAVIILYIILVLSQCTVHRILSYVVN